MASSSLDDPTGVPCPKRGCPGEVVYNGNYFCELLPHRECDWAAPENWLQMHPEAYAGLMEYRARRQMIDVSELPNFDRELYEKGAL